MIQGSDWGKVNRNILVLLTYFYIIIIRVVYIANYITPLYDVIYNYDRVYKMFISGILYVIRCKMRHMLEM